MTRTLRRKSEKSCFSCKPCNLSAFLIHTQEHRKIQPEALPINFLLPIKGTPLGDADISGLTTEYCMKVLCLARLLVPKADIRCAAGREVYFKGEEKKLLSVVDSIFASGYLTEGGQGIEDTLKTITDAGFIYEIESA